jgi:hypothetical protein
MPFILLMQEKILIARGREIVVRTGRDVLLMLGQSWHQPEHPAALSYACKSPLVQRFPCERSLPYLTATLPQGCSSLHALGEALHKS